MKRRGPKMCTFGFLGLLCEAPAAPSGSGGGWWVCWERVVGGVVMVGVGWGWWWCVWVGGGGGGVGEVVVGWGGVGRVMADFGQCWPELVF